MAYFLIILLIHMNFDIRKIYFFIIYFDFFLICIIITYLITENERNFTSKIQFIKGNSVFIW